MATASELPPKASLLGLPAELRMSIFEQFLTDAHLHLGRPNITYGRSAYAVLSLSKQLRSEILPIFYPAVTVEFVDGFTESKLVSWLNAIGREAISELKRIVFHCKGRCSMYGLQPDTDFCHRSAYIDLSIPEEDFLPGMIYLLCYPLNTADDRGLCSNDAFGCKEQSINALSEGMKTPELDFQLTADELLRLWRGLTEDNSASVA